MIRKSERPIPGSVIGGTDRRPAPSRADGPVGLDAASRRARDVGLSLVAVVALGFLGIVSLLRLVVRDTDSALAGISPMDLDRDGRLVALLAGSTALALALGLWRRKRLAWALSIMTFAVALLVQVAFVHHPWGAAASLVILVVLVIGRRRFDVRSAPIWGRLAIFTIVSVAGLAFVSGLLGSRAADPWSAAESVLGGIVVWIAAALGVDDGARTQVLHESAPAILSTATGVVLLVARLLILVTAVGELNPAPDRPPRPGDVADALAVLRREGRGALLPFQGAPSMSLYLSRSGRTVIAHARAGRMDVVLGDPIGSPSDFAAAMSEFVEDARLADHAVAVYQATAEARDILRGSGFHRIFQIGQEAVVDLATFGLDGSRRANLRHTVTRFHRDGATIRWFALGLDDVTLAELGDQLAGVDVAWQRKAGPKLGFTINSFRRGDLRTTPIAISLDGSGRVVAFVTFQATGADGGYVVDLIRRLPGSVPGAVETCVAEAAIAMRDAGATRLSLGLAPIHGLDAHRGPLEERAIRVATGAVARWYDVDSLAFFKAKFDPTWEPRYVAARHRRDALVVSVALLRLHLGRGGTLLGIERILRGTRFWRASLTGATG